MKNRLYIITGPAGVGKSTISLQLANNLEKSVLIEGNVIYNFFVGGRIKPWYKDAPLDLFWKNVKYLIKSYLENGYDVVFNYIVNPEKYDELKNEFKDYKVIFKVLLTDEKTLIERDNERMPENRMGNRSIELLKEFKNYKYVKENILDTTNLSVVETVKRIMEEV